MPFASPGLKGTLFTYGGPACRGSSEHTGSYAVIDVEATGLAPTRGDWIIEIAVARVDAAGRIEDEYATLINPEGRDTGPVFIHGISNDAVAKAPTFADVAPDLLARLDGAVVVAHNAPFEERFLGTYGQPVHYTCGTFTGPGGTALGTVRPVTRAVELRKGTDGWMHSLMARLPMSASDVDDAAAEVYLDALAEALSDGKIIGEEAKYLAKLAGHAGMGGAQVAALNERFLESLRQAALEDGVLTAAELKQLTTAAKALSVPGFFDDLAPTSTATARPDEQVREFRLQRVREAMEDGWTNAQLATDLGVGTGTVEKLKREVRGEPSQHNNLQRADRLERAQAALQLQQSGLSRAAVAEKLELSVESVKALLRDAKFYADPTSDPSRLELAHAARAARTGGLTREQFQTDRGLTKGKAAEAWGDGDVVTT